jgi:hypothetical protein
MNKAVVKPRSRLRPTDEAQVAAVVMIHSGMWAGTAGDHPELPLDRLAGETDLFALIDQLLVQVARDSAAVDVIDREIDTLTTRKSRLTKRAVSAREILEQAFLTAGLRELDRPLATLRLSTGPATLVLDKASAIPARYWRPSAPVLDAPRLTRELKGRQAALEALLATPAKIRARALAGFQRRFLSDAEARELRARLAGLDACDSCEARAVALAALRRDFASFPGVRLAGAVPTLAIHLRRRPTARAGPARPIHKLS